MHSILLALLAANLVLPSTAVRSKFSDAEIGVIATNESWDWPWQKVKQCGVAAGSWAQAGEEREGGVRHSLDVPRVISGATEPSLCSSGSFAYHLHGDRTNEVLYKGDGRFLYVQGNEPGTGAGVTLCDVRNKPDALEYVYTNGLTGCMAVIIAGTHRDSGTRDLFFAHSRRWSNYINKAAIPEVDPLRAAREFARTHNDLSVFYGTGDHVMDRDGHFRPSTEASYLSYILGVPVSNEKYHSLPFRRRIMFDIHHETLFEPTGKEESVVMFKPDYAQLAAIYKNRAYVPNHILINKLATMEQVEDSDQLVFCVKTLRACAARDFNMVNALQNNAKEPKQYGDELKGVIKQCYNDMVAQGFKKQVHEVLNYRAPTYKVSVPAEPAQGDDWPYLNDIHKPREGRP